MGMTSSKRGITPRGIEVDGKIVSLDEWRRIKRRVKTMGIEELAMTTSRLVDLMLDLASHLEELESRVDSPDT